MLEEFTEICSSGRNLLLKTFKVQTIQQTEDQCQLLEQNWCVKALKLPRLLYWSATKSSLTKTQFD